MALLRRHCPVAWVHRSERLRPTTIEAYVEQCSLVDAASGALLAPALSGDGREIARLAEERGGTLSGAAMRYHGPGPGPRLRDARLEGVPFYGSVRREPVGGHEVASLTYLMLWPVNYGYRCCCWWLGYHDADWEQLRVVVHEPSGEVLAVCFRAHASDQGQWRAGAECEFWDAGRRRPVMYVAPGGHGTYPCPGWHPRIFGLANDVLAQDIPWNASGRVEALPGWAWAFRGQFGPGCNNPVWRKEFATLGPTAHIRPVHRLLYPLSRPWIRHADVGALVEGALGTLGLGARAGGDGAGGVGAGGARAGGGGAGGVGGGGEGEGESTGLLGPARE